MGDTPVLLKPSEVDSIVLGAAENAARHLGYILAAPAKDLLLTRSMRSLNEDNEKGTLETRRPEIEQNTAALIQHIVIEYASKAGEAPEITYQHMTLGLSAFCRKFPKFYPFCTSP